MLAKEPAIENAILCTVCGCAWVRDPRGIGHVLGTLRRDGPSWRWISAYKIPNARKS